MNRKTKLFLMFGPFLIFFAALALMVSDARHPSIQRDECRVIGTGQQAQTFKAKGRIIYQQSDNLNNDVSLRCDKLGTLILNDAQLFITPVETGQGAWVSRKHYQFLPDRWMVSVYTGPPKK